MENVDEQRCDCQEYECVMEPAEVIVTSLLVLGATVI